MKILPRAAPTALLTLVLAGLSSPALRAQETPEPARLSADGWEIQLRPRFGIFMAQWEYAEDRHLPRRPTAGFEVLVRRANPRFGARLLGELTGAWAFNDLADWGRIGVERAGRPPRRLGTVVADIVMYAPQDEDVIPYAFLGGGSRMISLNEAGDIFADPYSGEMPHTRAATIHGGVGFEVRVGGVWAVFEVGDYYGHFLDFGKVHDIHTTLMFRLPGFGDMIETVTTLGGEPSGERR